MPDSSHHRIPDYPVDQEFPDRWSPRAFDPKPVPREYLRVIFEAARWAPSSMNEQPWRFLVADGGGRLALFRSLLKPSNQIWANTAPVLCFVVVKRHFDKDGKENAHARFDGGAAWMSVALQARKMGLYTHAMGGIEVDAVYEKLAIDREKFDVVCGMAMGHKGEAATLPDDLRAREFPSVRRSQDGTVFFEKTPTA